MMELHRLLTKGTVQFDAELDIERIHHSNEDENMDPLVIIELGCGPGFVVLYFLSYNVMFS